MTRHMDMGCFDIERDRRTEDWAGHSGRHYLLAPVSMAQLCLADGSIYLLARRTPVNEHAMWVGGEDELIGDPASRAQFRKALSEADHAYRLRAPADDLERLTAVWELDGASRQLKRSAA